ncbi:MAG TPA: DUF3857 domain-containing protein [Puia sp.]|nr:DUF3857 domain-containing protein [Puia sp.]
MAAVQHPSARAQSDPAKYKERAYAVRQEVWGWNIPAFKQKTVPAEYSGESTVILAKRAVIEADSKKKMNWVMLGAQRNFYYNSTVREMVKINDKVSLEEYSQLSYRQFKRLNGWASASSSTFVGARIIKPDGSVKEVSEDESVLLKASKNDLQRKLAISDLQVGDILDYYVRVEELSEAIKAPERMIFIFGEEHPILDYSIHCNLGDKYALEYLSMNKAPEAKLSTNQDKDIILDLDVQHIAATPTGLWMSSLRELPALRINVLAGGYGRPKGEVVNGVTLAEVIGAMDSRLQITDYQWQALSRKYVFELLRDYDKHYAKFSEDSLAYLIYYAYRFFHFYDMINHDAEVGQEKNMSQFNDYVYLPFLKDLLDHYNIPCSYVALPSRYGPGINQVMSLADLNLMLKVDLKKPIYFNNNNMFTYPDYIASYQEGQPYTEVFHKNRSRRKDPGSIEDHIPVSEAIDNVHRENLQIAIDGGEMQLLHVKRHTVLTGRMKEDEQLRLLNFEDCYESERTALHLQRSLMEEIKKDKTNKKVYEDYVASLKKARASLKDRFKDEVESEYDQQPKDMVAWKVDNPGIRHNTPDLIYTTEFTLDGLVQRAGNNYLLNIGKLINSPLKLTPSQRTRTVDVYMAYARILDCTVTFDVPQGFTVQGADKLNKTIDNECGSVIATAQLQGSKLLVHFKRVYKHNVEPAGKWPMMLAIIDASMDFAGQKVLLKKG